MKLIAGSTNKLRNAANECIRYFEFHDSKLESVSSNFKFKTVMSLKIENIVFLYVMLPQITFNFVTNVSNSCGSLGNYLKKKDKADYYVTKVKFYVFLIRPC